MIALIRNCSHGSEISTYIIYENHQIIKILKVSSTPAGIKNLNNEVEGWKWYEFKRYQNQTPICNVIERRKSYLKIQIEFIRGHKPDYKKGIVKNFEILKKIVDHYQLIWPYSTDDDVPIHGDLSLDNIIHNGDGVHIIDWEHFYSKGGPWGYDIFYLILETLKFGMRGRPLPTPQEIDIINELIDKLLVNYKINKLLMTCPLNFIRNYILSNAFIWGEQLFAFPGKLPVLYFTDSQVSFIDQSIGRI